MALESVTKTEPELETHETYESVPFRMHPRVFDALGANLVTDDVVAVIELIKNSFDAFAQNVWVKFAEDPSEGVFLEITDDGMGMTKETIEDVWCMVATPYKDSNPVIKKGNKVRRVVGEKGLGRLSAARLGDRLTMLTQAPHSPCWEVNVDWSVISGGDDLSQSFARRREYPEKSPFAESGTRLTISGLSGEWDGGKVDDLEENLARLISPFSEMDDFNIFLHGLSNEVNETIRIESPEFLAQPKYSIKGKADNLGNIEGTYQFSPLSRDGNARVKKVSRKWELVRDEFGDDRRFRFSDKDAQCGPFSFEMRAWDIAGADTREISEHFGYPRSLIRKSISAHKGISIYRDGVLVLPKSENARDWLGLDLRRVSNIGRRLSTSQLVGYVSISADDNPQIGDTSDRERLASCVEVAQFEAIIKSVIGLLETERNEDRVQADREKPMDDLFSQLSADPLINQVDSLAQEGATASEALPLIRAFGNSLDLTRKTIQERFIYYSRLATIGTIAQKLVHEVRNRTIILGSLLKFVKDRIEPTLDDEAEEEIRSAQRAVDSLETLADSFAPLASRNFRRGQRHSVLEDRIRGCLTMHRRDIRNRGVQCSVPDAETIVAVDPGELDAILLNLVTNATYWLGEVPREQRKLEFAIEPFGNADRVRVWVHDTGPGIDEEYVDKVFWPGVTLKSGGIGMGLTVASELVEAYGGQMLTKHPGEMGGASFAFDLPLLEQ